jgi:hypothetical protein
VLYAFLVRVRMDIEQTEAALDVPGEMVGARA